MWEKELNAMIEAGRNSREIILNIYQKPFDIEIKKDNSPVTLADKEADKFISNYLKERFPSYSFLTEESIDDLHRLDNDYCFIIDPVDGTQDFCARNGEFATNIALSYKHEIVVGVVVIPCENKIYYAIKNQGAFCLDGNNNLKKIHVNDKLDHLTLLTSRFHSSSYEKNLPQKDHRITKVEAYGSSIKACRIAEGLAEIHYRLNEGTKEWDIAPIDLIVKEAGGYFIKPDETSYQYNKKDVYNHDGYIITNKLENIYKE